MKTCKPTRRDVVGQVSDRWKRLAPLVAWERDGRGAASILTGCLAEVPRPLAHQRAIAVEWLNESDVEHWRWLMDKFRERLEAVRVSARTHEISAMRRNEISTGEKDLNKWE